MFSTKEAEKIYLDAEKYMYEDINTLNSFIISKGCPMEGNCFYLHHQQDLSTSLPELIYKRINYYTLLKHRHVKKMIEIGFNAGHSATVFLHALPKDSIFLSFDLCEHPYTKECFEYLQSKHPQLKHMIEGDSTVTLPKFIEENPSEIGTYDVIHVDGGHSAEVCLSDLRGAHILLKPGGVLILDDTNADEIMCFIPSLEHLGYKMLFQIPTHTYSHILFEKPM